MSTALERLGVTPDMVQATADMDDLQVAVMAALAASTYGTYEAALADIEQGRSEARAILGLQP